MKKNKIENSVVADKGSTISNVNNTVSTKRIKTVSGVVGFILGIITSIIGSYIYENFLK